jgi:hypothetical protein
MSGKRKLWADVVGQEETSARTQETAYPPNPAPAKMVPPARARRAENHSEM